jgi:hypothetical protein
LPAPAYDDPIDTIHASRENIMTHNKTRRCLIAACALACIALAPQAEAGDWPWSKSEQVQGSGRVQSQARDVAHFSGLAMSLQGNVEIRSGSGREGVTVEADDNLLPLIETVVEDGTLKIRAKRNTNLRTRNLKVVVQARDIDRLALGGSGNIDADVVRGSRVRFDVGGSGSIKVHKLEGESVNIALGGSGNLQALDGTARSTSISIGGSGTVDMGHVRTENASVTVAGSGDATLWVRDSLSLTVAGSGDVNYYGDPQVTRSVVGSGNVKRLGASPR